MEDKTKELRDEVLLAGRRSSKDHSIYNASSSITQNLPSKRHFQLENVADEDLNEMNRILLLQRQVLG